MLSRASSLEAMPMRMPLHAAFVAMLLSGIAIVARADDAPKAAKDLDRRRRIEAWHKEMARHPFPKKGCHRAKHPSRQWQEVPCTTPPNRPYPPSGVEAHRHFAAETSGLISSSIGSFESVDNVTNEKDGTFSLQLNSSFFTSPACKSAGCVAWQQFIYSSREGTAFMQYWLLGHGAPCPKGWTSNPPACWRNSEKAVQVGKYEITQLAGLALGGSTVAGGKDRVTMKTPDSTVHTAGEDSVLGLAQGWRYAEFVVVGDGGGAEAVFNPGATIVVRTDIDDGTTTAPRCATRVFTAETNNLSLVAPCCPHGGSSPGIVFTLSSAKDATSTCAGAGASSAGNE